MAETPSGALLPAAADEDWPAAVLDAVDDAPLELDVDDEPVEVEADDTLDTWEAARVKPQEDRSVPLAAQQGETSPLLELAGSQ